MADVKDDARFGEFLSANNMTMDEYESSNDDVKAWVSKELDDWKEKNPVDITKDARFEEFLSANNMTMDEYKASNADVKDWVSKELDEWKTKNPVKEDTKEDKAQTLTPEQRAYLDNYSGQMYGEDATWDSLTAEDKRALKEEGLEPKKAEPKEEKPQTLTPEQRAYLDNYSGQMYGEDATWDSLTAEDKRALKEEGLETKLEAKKEEPKKEAEEKQEEASAADEEPKKEDEEKEEEAVLETEEEKAPSYTLEEAMAIVNNAGNGFVHYDSTTELYNMTPAELVALDSVLKEGAAKGDAAVVKGYESVNNAITEKLISYSKGEINIPIEWADDMQKMIEVSAANNSENLSFKEQEVKPLSHDDAEKALAALKEGKDIGTQTLASLVATPQAYGSTGPAADLVEKAVSAEVAKMNGSKNIAKENFSSLDVILNKAQYLPETQVSKKDYQKAQDNLAKNRETVEKERAAMDKTSLLESCQTNLNNFTKEYDENHGLTGLTPENAPQVAANIEAMESMGLDSLETKPYEEAPVKGMSLDDAEKVLASLEKGEQVDTKTLAALVATPQAYGSTGPAADLIEKAVAAKVKEVNKSKELPADELASIGVILDKAQYLPETQVSKKDFQKSTAKLEAGREEAKKNPQAKYPEMDDALAVLNNLEITDGLKLTGKKKSKEEEELKAQFIESVRLKTQQDLAGTVPGPVSAEEFNKSFAANIVAEVEGLAGVQSAVEGKSTVLDDAAKGKKIKISKDALLGYQANASNQRAGFNKRLESKVGKIPAINKLKENDNKLNNKLVKANPKRFGTLKALGKSAGWMGAYWAAGAVAGPAGIAVVASVSLANQTIKLAKKYKKQKAEMKAKGQKLKLWSFMKENKMAIAGAALTAAGAVTAGMSAAMQAGAEISPDVISSLQVAKAKSGIALGVASSIKTFKDARAGGASVWKALGASSLSGAGTAWAVIAGQSHESTTLHNESPQVDGVTGAAVHVDNSASVEWDKDGNGVPDSIQRPAEETFEMPKHPWQQEQGTDWDKNGNGVPDSIERPNPEWDKDGNGVPDSIQRPADQMEDTTPKQEAPVKEAPVKVQPAQEAPVKDQEPVVAEPEKLKPLEMPELKPAGIHVDSNMDEIVKQAGEDMKDLRVHTIVDSNGQEVKYTTDENGLHLVNADKVVGHENLNADIAKDVAARAEAGNASQNDINAMQNRVSEEELTKIQEAHDSHKLMETQIDQAPVKDQEPVQYVAEGENKEYSPAELQQKIAQGEMTEPEAAKILHDQAAAREAGATESEKAVEKPVEKAEEKVVEKTEEKPVEKTTEKTVEPVTQESSTVHKVDGASFKGSYTVDDKGGLQIKGGGTGNVDQDVMNKVTAHTYKTAEGLYRVGDSVSPSMQVARDMAEMDVRTTSLNNDIYNDMAARAKEGAELSPQEKGFMNMHDQKLEKLGLERGEDGKLQPAPEKGHEHQNTQEQETKPKKNFFSKLRGTSKTSETQVRNPLDSLQPSKEVLDKLRTVRGGKE